ncbi:MAG: efflux RND transporter periplasmic adaptor subunit [Cyanobacteria bacterium P01_C01_bin.69]
MSDRTNDSRTDETLLFQLPSQLSQPRHRSSSLEVVGTLVRSLTDSLIRPKRLAVGIVLVILAAAGGERYLNRASADRFLDNPPEASPVSETPFQSVALHTVERATVEDSFALTGTVAAKNLLQITPPVEGLKILEMRAAEGDFVSAGQVLAVLDDRVLQAQLRQSQASLMQAQADLHKQEAMFAKAQVNRQATAVDMQRYERLYSQGAVSQVQLGDRQVQAFQSREGVAVAMADLESARASIASQLSEIDVLEALLAQSVVTAPMAGIVAQRQATVGDTAMAGQPLYSLIEEGQLVLEIAPSQTQLAQLAVGTPVTVSAVDKGRAFELRSRVFSIEPTLDAQSRQATVNILLPDESSTSANYNLRPGMFLQADVVTEQRRSVVVPAAAVINQPDGTAVVFTLDEDRQGENQVQATVVEVATRLEQLSADASSSNVANQVEILSGLEVGSRVVVSGASYLQQGDRVSVVSEATP